MEGIPTMNFLGISLFLLHRSVSLSNRGIPIPLTQVENLDNLKIVIPVEGLEKAVFKKNGVKYLSFEVAKLRTEDDLPF